MRRSIQKIRRFIQNKDGNFGILFVGTAIPCMICIGFIIDTVQIYSLQTRAMNVTDAAIMAAAAHVRESDVLEEKDRDERIKKVEVMLEEQFKNFYESNPVGNKSVDFKGYHLNFNPDDEVFHAQVDLAFRTNVYKRLTHDEIEFSVSSAVKVQLEKHGALSIGLVLDRSGSMGGSKIVALKSAVNEMFDEFQKIDPAKQYIRAGAWTYNSKMSDNIPLKWNISAVSKKIQKIYASGGTSSTTALKTAWERLAHKREENQHKKRSGLDHRKVMVFMTDGSNNYSSDDTQTMQYCDKAKADKIEIYTVAFQAPSRGEELLKYCASGAETYFEAGSNAALIDAFRKIGKSAAGKIHFTN